MKPLLKGLLAGLLLLTAVPSRSQEGSSSTGNPESLPTTVVDDTQRENAYTPAPVRQVLAEPETETVTVFDTTSGESLTVPNLAEAEELIRIQPGGVAIVDAEDYRSGRANNLKDALDFAPGVFVQPRFGSEESRLSIRGSGIQRTFHGRGLKLMQDGAPLNLADGGFDFQAVEPLAAQYIEVYRGANALEYGSTTLGGAVNFVSHTGHTAPPLLIRAEYGSFDTFRGQISSGIVSGNTDAFVSFTHSSTDGFRDHSKQESQRLFTNLGWTISPEWETRFYITYVNTDSELPGDLTRQQLETDPTQAARVPEFLRGIQPVARFDRVTSDWRRDFELFRVANKTTWHSGDESVSIGTFWSYKDLDHPILFVIDQVTNDFGLSVRYDNTADLFGKENHFLFGFAPTIGVTEDNRFSNDFGALGAQFSDSTQTSLNTDLYLQNSHYFLPDVAFVVGGQLSYARRENEDNWPVSAMNPDNSDTQDWWAFSPKVGLLWDVAEDAQVYANVSRSFEPPSFGELVNPANNGTGLLQLSEQTATTLEVGTRGWREGLRWDLAYYYSFVDGELLSYQVQPGLAQTINADDTIHQGIEAALDIDLFNNIFVSDYSTHGAKSGKSVYSSSKNPPVAVSDRLVFRQNYLWNDFRFEDDTTFGDNRLPGIPEHYYRAELIYEHPGGIYLGPNVEWVPTRYAVDSAETEFTSSYTLLGFKAGYRSETGPSFYVEAKNLTDEVYAATTSVVDTFGGQALFLPGDGRSYHVGIEWKW